VSAAAGELLAAARLARGRFRGRAALTRSAEAGDLASLGELCERLGIPLPERGWGRAETWRRAHAPVTAPRHPAPRVASRGERPWGRAPRAVWGPDGLRTLAAIGAAVDAAVEIAAQRDRAERRREVERLRGARRDARRGIPQPAQSGRILRLHRRNQIEAAARAAGLRTALHGHEDTVVLVPEGEEDATSDSESVWSSQAGMSAAYCRQAYTVTQSCHTWRLAGAPWAHDGRVYLSEGVRVRNGRGTHLVVERLEEGRGGRLVWRRS